MSALPPKADIHGYSRNVCFVPTADITRLFDHFIGACNYCRGYCETESLGGFEIDGQLILGRCLHRHVGRILTLVRPPVKWSQYAPSVQF
jgi:hypothetical protein